ncbi:putative Dihydroorotate dehydrogenase [Trypanosoma vivax]|nr:putative Dihydroorotate dehydrogenase [Trypanosoma vivax]
MSLKVHLLGRSFANPFMNAAGVLCTTEGDLQQMSASGSGSLISKSCTLESRVGNPEPRYYDLPLGSINSMGLPNLGADFYVEYAAKLHDHSAKPLFMSVSGLSVEESVSIVKKLVPLTQEKGVLLELNLSCPNVPESHR